MFRRFIARHVTRGEFRSCPDKREAVAIPQIARLALSLTLATLTVLAVRPAQAQVVELINQQRAAHGLPALTPVAELANAANRHVWDMMINGVTSHTGSDGSSPLQRIQDAGYSASWWGENIGNAWNSDQASLWSDADMVRWWMNSPPHRASILNPNFTQIGAAVAQEERVGSSQPRTFYRYWCVDFGAR